MVNVKKSKYIGLRLKPALRDRIDALVSSFEFPPTLTQFLEGAIERECDRIIGRPKHAKKCVMCQGAGFTMNPGA